jgi:hypothetical protein
VVLLTTKRGNKATVRAELVEALSFSSKQRCEQRSEALRQAQGERRLVSGMTNFGRQSALLACLEADILHAMSITDKR